MKNLLQKFSAATPAPTDPVYIINILVDTAYIFSQQSGMWQNGNGIYMLDNNVSGGSNGEGGFELNTTCQPMMSIGFNVIPINQYDTNLQSLTISGFQFSDGTNIFQNGYPTVQTPEQCTCQWMGTPTQTGNMTYQILVNINYGALGQKNFWWDPFFTCTN